VQRWNLVHAADGILGGWRREHFFMAGTFIFAQHVSISSVNQARMTSLAVIIGRAKHDIMTSGWYGRHIVYVSIIMQTRSQAHHFALSLRFYRAFTHHFHPLAGLFTHHLQARVACGCAHCVCCLRLDGISNPRAGGRATIGETAAAISGIEKKKKKKKKKKVQVAPLDIS
jgi:hypothetical protein